MPSVARSVEDPLLSHRANATATLDDAVAARDAGVRRFIYAGSSSVYGDTPTLPKREDMKPAAAFALRGGRSWSASTTCACSPRSTAWRP